MKRRDLIKTVKQIAKTQGYEYSQEEGGSHTKVMFDGKFVTTIPRHNEVNEITAKGIIKQAEKGVE